MNFVLTVIKTFFLASIHKETQNFFLYIYTLNVLNIPFWVLTTISKTHTHKQTHEHKTVSAWIKSRQRSRVYQSFPLFFFVSFIFRVVFSARCIFFRCGASMTFFGIPYIYRSHRIFLFLKDLLKFYPHIFSLFYRSLFSTMKNCALLPEIN